MLIILDSRLHGNDKEEDVLKSLMTEKSKPKNEIGFSTK
jgi:hypothetical protein